MELWAYIIYAQTQSYSLGNLDTTINYMFSLNHLGATQTIIYQQYMHIVYYITLYYIADTHVTIYILHFTPQDSLTPLL